MVTLIGKKKNFDWNADGFLEHVLCNGCLSSDTAVFSFMALEYIYTMIFPLKAIKNQKQTQSRLLKHGRLLVD